MRHWSQTAKPDQHLAYALEKEALFEARIEAELDVERQSQARTIFSIKNCPLAENRAAFWECVFSPEYRHCNPFSIQTVTGPFRLLCEKLTKPLAQSGRDLVRLAEQREDDADKHGASYKGVFKGPRARGKAPRKDIDKMRRDVNRSLRALRACGRPMPDDLQRDGGYSQATNHYDFRVSIHVIAQPDRDQACIYDIHRIGLDIPHILDCRMSWIVEDADGDGNPAIVTPDGCFAWLLDRQDSILAYYERRKLAGAEPDDHLLVWKDRKGRVRPYRLHKLRDDLAEIVDLSPKQAVWRGIAELLARGCSIFYARQSMNLISESSLKKLNRVQRRVLELKAAGEFEEIAAQDHGPAPAGKRWCTVCKQWRLSHLARCPDCKGIFQQPEGSREDKLRWAFYGIMDGLIDGTTTRAEFARDYLTVARQLTGENTT